MSVWAVIPLKSPNAAKSRLSGVLSDSQRIRMFYLLSRRVIVAALSTPGVDGVTVVTASDEVAEIAAKLGAQCVQLEADRGTAAACSEALKRLPSRCLTSVLFLAGDLPLISPSALAPLVALSGADPLIAIAGDRRRMGTNALLCTPGDIIPLCFGDSSFTRHISAAAQLSITTRVIDSATLALDIDEPDDLAEWHRLLTAIGEPIDSELSDLFAASEEVLSQ